MYLHEYANLHHPVQAYNYQLDTYMQYNTDAAKSILLIKIR